jgi:hypothetical protein
MSTRKACEETLDEDSLLEHYDACQHAFIDITYGVKARVCREGYWCGIKLDCNFVESVHCDKRNKWSSQNGHMGGKRQNEPGLFSSSRQTFGLTGCFSGGESFGMLL